VLSKLDLLELEMFRNALVYTILQSSHGFKLITLHFKDSDLGRLKQATVCTGELAVSKFG
jgi:hypothetical protein